MAKRKGKMTEAEAVAIMKQLKWSQPLGLQAWSTIYGVCPNTMRQWLRDQAIRNEQISPRRWRIAIEELPAEMVINVLWEMELARAHQSAADGYS